MLVTNEREVIRVRIDPGVFNAVYLPYLDDDTPMQIFFGGSSSGKSVFEAQRCVYDLMGGHRNYLVCRALAKYSKKSTWAEITSVINEWGVNELFTLHISDGVIECENGCQAIFVGLDDTQKLKSIRPKRGAITDIWIEEATEIDYRDIKELSKRMRGGDEDVIKRITLTFNPILQDHWIFTTYFTNIGWTETQTEYHDDTISILKTTHTDNQFLTAEDHRKLEEEEDKYYYDVYTLGNWGVLGHVIFTKWIVADLNNPEDPYHLPPEQRTNTRNGGDFGYASDPAAIGCSHYDKTRKRIYVFSEFYETGYDNEALAAVAIRMFGHERSTWDSAEPKSIAELQKYGVNAVGAAKGKDSILFGIQWLKKQTIIVDKSCINMQNELRKYKWVEGRDGKPISPPRPVDKDNHLIDGGLRYAYENDMTGFEPQDLYGFA